MKNKVYILILLFFLGCQESIVNNDNVTCNIGNYITENVILVIIDGPRMSETWEHPEQKYIPFLSGSLKQKAVINREFYNLGNTYTIPGHIALTTGSYEFKTNDGRQYPSHPSMFQLFLSCNQGPPSNACIITAKKKLEVLGDCESLRFRSSYRPQIYTEDRTDMETYKIAIAVLEEERPILSLIHFKGPDFYAHQGNWNKYLDAIVETDSLLNELVNFVEANNHYQGKTTIMMTNDHGRHLDGIASGYRSHGDHCRGCTHINFMGYGPDFKNNEIIYTQYESVDILPTIGEILGFQIDHPRGNIMTELFVN